MENNNMDEILDCNDEDGSYIEIELDPAAIVTTIGHNDHNDDDDDVEQEKENYKLRISISSTISVSLQKENMISAAEIGASEATLSLQKQQHSTDEVEFPWKSPTTVLETNTSPVMMPCDSVDDVLYARKQPSLTTTNGIIMKLLIKFRGIKIRSIFASLKKQRQNTSKKSITFFQCYEKGYINPSPNGRNTSNHWNLQDDSISGSLRKSKRLMEMDLGAIKGVFNGIGMSKRRSKRTLDGSTSTSCNNSPNHEGFLKENSIQAAIAYCKGSFGQTSDFTFTSSTTSTPSRFVA